MIPSTFPPKEEIARLTARMLLEIRAVHFNAAEPFTLASGLPSPTYIDCRRLISYPRIRAVLMDFLAVTVMREAGFVIRPRREYWGHKKFGIAAPPIRTDRDPPGFVKRAARCVAAIHGGIAAPTHQVFTF